MKQLIKFIATVVLTVCLPLQGFAAAAAMPLCSAPEGSQATAMPMHSTSISNQMAPACNNDGQQYCASHSGQKSEKNSGEKCFACHLGTAQLPPVFAVTAQPEIATEFPPLTNDDHQTFPPGLFRPPKPIFA
jgi:hypothetical protein